MYYLTVNKKYVIVDKKPTPRRQDRKLSCHSTLILCQDSN